jgi:hypothetical protein
MELLEIIKKKVEENKLQTITLSEMNHSLIELTKKNGHRLLFKLKNEYGG